MIPKPQLSIILASASPRRAELLTLLGLDYTIQPSSIDEALRDGEAPVDYIMRLCRAKVAEVAAKHEAGLVLGADTIVVVEGEILGKPFDDRDARRMLHRLAGRWHSVMTGVAIIDSKTKLEVADYTETRVKVCDLTEEEIEWYISTGEPRDKAGAYAIQGKAGIFIEAIQGNYHNVVGLPLTLLNRLAKQLNVQLV